MHIHMYVYVYIQVVSDILYSSIKVGLGISQTKTDSQRNPVYKAFHRIHCCGNETIRR